MWTFARTDEETLKSLMTDGLGLGLQKDESTPIDMGGGKTMANLVHSSRFIVVSPEGRVVGMYRGTDPGEVDQMARDLRQRAHGGREPFMGGTWWYVWLCQAWMGVRTSTSRPTIAAADDPTLATVVAMRLSAGQSARPTAAAAPPARS